MATPERIAKRQQKKEERKRKHETEKHFLNEARNKIATEGEGMAPRLLNANLRFYRKMARRAGRLVVIQDRRQKAQTAQDAEIERQAIQLAHQEIIRQEESISPEQFSSLIDTVSGG